MKSDTDAHQHLPLDPSRRSFLGALLGLASAFIGALLAVPVLRYISYPLTANDSKDSDWTEIGSVASIGNVQTPLRRPIEFKQRDGWRETASQPVIYIIKTGGTLKALSAICPHLGCIVPWDPGRNEFVCPCHGGTFSADGTRLSGPPRRSLDSLETKSSGGTLMVKYQYFRPDVTSKEVIG
jgi:menaquinol-cytochrome c reductase iron-sulfur subunit